MLQKQNVLGLFLYFVYVYFKCCSKRRKATFWVQGAAGVTFQSFLIFFFLLKDKSSRSVEVVRITPLSGMNACTTLCNSPSHGCLDMLEKNQRSFVMVVFEEVSKSVRTARLKPQIYYRSAETNQSSFWSKVSHDQMLFVISFTEVM